MEKTVCTSYVVILDKGFKMLYLVLESILFGSDQKLIWIDLKHLVFKALPAVSG